MKSIALATVAVTLGLAACTTVPENAKPYSCAEYNKHRAELTKNPAAVSRGGDMLKFLKVNKVGFQAGIGKHPSREDVMRSINDSVDIQAMQCRLDPAATVNYTADIVQPASVRLGYHIAYSKPEPKEVRDARYNLKVGKPVADEAGMQPVKDYIQNCAAGAASAKACKLGGL